MEELFASIQRMTLERLMSGPTEEFKKLKTGAEMIKYCREEILKARLIDKNEVAAGKNEKLAIEARSLANNLFMKEKDFVQALELYNKSLCLSPVGSENIGICYANRSAVFFESGFYQFCLDNIELALENNYPEQMKPKLEARRLKCLEFLKKSKKESAETESAIELSFPASKLNPFIIDGIELKTSEEFGRHICAKRDLFPGHVIMIDKPYFQSLEVGAENKFCNNCHNQNLLNLVPCEFCINAMYCGSACKEEAWKRFHKFECKLSRNKDRLSTRALLKTFTLFDDLDKLRNLLQLCSENPVTAFYLKQDDEIETFKAIYCLETNRSQRTVKFKYEYAMTVAHTWHSLITQSPIKSLLKTTKDEDFFLDTWFHFGLIRCTNSHELMIKTSDRQNFMLSDGSLQKFGSAICPVISLLNHSCASNVTRIFGKGKFAIMVLRNIKAGEQIFNNYGAHHATDTKVERQEKLLDLYAFTCKCVACVQNYPTINDMPMKNSPEFISLFMDFAHSNNPKQKRKLLNQNKQKIATFLKKHDHQYPNFEIMALQNKLTQLAQSLYEPLPLKMQLKPLTK
ncbi:SET and MYND domain-containing protein 4-like [Culicoides brevitarsis]|uniref:SET and MYND domain-containing protein 4-like n=1 Tax=Culicoides brevitarsis TaxID=469753 RepID=UPI00307B5A79